MLKLIFIMLVFFNFVFGQSLTNESLEPESKAVSESQTLVGGWYPVFFNKYSNKKVNKIINSIKEGHVKKVEISFDKNDSLAIKIKNKIELKTKFPVVLRATHTEDTKETQYNHNLVVVTIWNKQEKNLR